MPGPGDSEAGGPRAGTQAVERAIAILFCFSPDRPALGISEIARSVGLNVSTAHRLVKALVGAGLVEHDPMSERYRLGIGVAVLGHRALEQTGFHLAKPILAELAASTGESASLGIRRGHEVVVIERAASVQPLRFDHPTGAEIPMHASAMGKVLLAFSGVPMTEAAASLEELPRYTLRTIDSHEALVIELEAIRTRGVAINREERYHGVSGIAAPVSSPGGIARAAVGVQGPSLRLTAARLKELTPLLRRAADEVSARVFWE
ncbi:MAG: IclR family transcriptional regulator [Ilumatobacteraceae bacterium]